MDELLLIVGFMAGLGIYAMKRVGEFISSSSEQFKKMASYVPGLSQV